MYPSITALSLRHVWPTLGKRSFLFSLFVVLSLSYLSLHSQFPQWLKASAHATFKKREITAQICGTVSTFRPATLLSGGSLRINNATYNIAPGVVIGGETLISPSQNLCFDLTFNNNGEVTFGSKLVGAVVSLCGIVENYKPATNLIPGSITISGTTYPIVEQFTLTGANHIAVGANMCLTALLNGGGQLARPSLIAPNVTHSLKACGPVTAYTAATATLAGSVHIGGMAFTVAPGTIIPALSVGSNQCLTAFTDVYGRLISPTLAGANAGGVTQLCGVVTDFQGAVAGANGFIRIGYNRLLIADSVRLNSSNKLAVGSSICLNLTLANGQLANGSIANAAVDECPQLTAPTLVHGKGEGNDEIYTLPDLTVFTATSSQAGGAMSFSVQGGFPGYDVRNISGLAASTPNSVVKAVSCTDSYWDFFFSIGTKGAVEGDMVKVVLQSPNSNNGQMLAMFTVQNGGLVLNAVSPWLSLRTYSSSSVPVGSFFPVLAPGPGGFQYTYPFTMVFSMDSRSPYNGCFQLGIELKRAGGNGMLAFVPLQSIVKRMEHETDGEYPTIKPCDTICPPCNDLPPPASLSGYVYCDLNNDGIRQATEPSLPDANVTLTGTDVNGPVNLSTTTDVNGLYSFNNLRPGTYTLTETQPPSTLDGIDALGSLGGTLGNDVISNIQLGTISGVNYNFGEICNGSLAGFVYCDTNADGIKQAAEMGLPGVTITLTGTSAMGPVNKTVQTDNNGEFRFDNLSTGTYTITESQPPGYGDGQDAAGTLGGTVANDVISNISVNNTQGINYNFGESCNRSLSGFVYCDGNNDGARQNGEPGLANVTVALTGTTAQGGVNRTTTTDANGNYSFTNLQPGTYTITETQPPGYGDGADTAGSLGGTVANDVISNIVVTNADGTGYAFGERCGGNLSGFVYCDTNNDGVRQAGEGGVPGVTVTLSGAANRTTTTDNNGNYSFANLQPGTYTLTETQPPGFGDGKDTLGSIGGTAGNDLFSNIVLTNTDGTGYAFGEACLGGLSGYVFCDFNDDGIRQNTENGIAGVGVNLTGTDINGPVSRMTSTNLSGFYNFPNLLPGTYIITEIQPPGNVDGKDMVGTLGGVVGNDIFSSIVLSSNIGTDYNFGEACMPTKCDTICYRTPREWVLRGRYPSGAIMVAGVNFNSPISIQRNLSLIRNVLTDMGSTGMRNLNREFVAFQISVAAAGGLSSPVTFNTYWSPLRCSGLNFAPVTLSNGFYITPDTLLNDLVLQTMTAIRENRTIDMQALADIFIILNTKC